MTQSEFFEKYGDVTVVFFDYYKYTFSYTGTTNEGNKITVCYGGNSEDIYRHEVSCGCEESISELMPYSGEVYDTDGKKIDEFYDY